MAFFYPPLPLYTIEKVIPITFTYRKKLPNSSVMPSVEKIWLQSVFRTADRSRGTTPQKQHLTPACIYQNFKKLLI
jgi:hypothetical protein